MSKGQVTILINDPDKPATGVVRFAIMFGKRSLIIWSSKKSAQPTNSKELGANK